MAGKVTPHFFRRDAHGAAVVRLKFRPAEASLYEEAAGDTPVIVWLHKTLNEAARAQVAAARAAGPDLPAPD